MVTKNVKKPSQVYWTAAEERAFLNGVRAIVRDDKSLRVIDACRRAMEQLPADRRRPPRLYVSLYGKALYPKIMAAYQEGLNLATPPKPTPVEPVPSIVDSPTRATAEPVPQPQPQPDLMKAIPQVAEREPVEWTPEPVRHPRDFSTGELLGFLAERLIASWDARLDRIEGAVIASLTANVPKGVLIQRPPGMSVPASNGLPVTSPPPPDQKNPRVGVIGLFKDQFEHLRAKAKELPYDLVYIDRESSIRQPLQVMDYALASHHIRHEWDVKLKALLGNERYFFIDGGISGLLKKLYDMNSIAKAAAQRVYA